MIPAKANNDHLVSRFNGRDIGAFGDVYSALYEHLHYFAAAVCRGSGLTPDDIVHDVFVKVWARRGVRFLSLDGIRAYMFTSIRNHFYDHTAHERHMAEYRRRLEEDDDDLFVVQMVDGGLRTWLNQAVDTLPAECGDVLRYHLDGWRVNEIAERMNISERTVHNRKAEATERLRAQFDRDALLIVSLIIADFYLA